MPLFLPRPKGELPPLSSAERSLRCVDAELLPSGNGLRVLRRTQCIGAFFMAASLIRESLASELLDLEPLASDPLGGLESDAAASALGG